MNCNETFNAGICYITDAYKRVCEFNEELHADLEKYRAENSKLQEELEDQEAYNQMLRDRLRQQTELCVKAEAENAKLRELVQSAVRCITDVPNCDSCALGEQVSGVWVCHLIGAAKELGVEVDG